MIKPDVIRLPDDGGNRFLHDYVYGNEWLAQDGAALARVLESHEPREAIADRMGVSVGALLGSLNASATVEPPIRYCYRNTLFCVRLMRGVCDDISGPRFGRFGRPLTIRFYVEDDIGLPRWAYEAADWNFMNAGHPGFVGYAYGGVARGTLFLSGLQSDLAARYAYLFQGRGGACAVRQGEHLVVLEPSSRVSLPPEAIQALRRRFQRRWIEVLFDGLRHVIQSEGLRRLAFQQFDLDVVEAQTCHQMRRIYRDFPRRRGARPLRVVTVDAAYDYLAIEEA